MITNLILWSLIALGAYLLVIFLPRLLGVVYIPHTRVGIIEKLWSPRGSLAEGRIIARAGEAGIQSRLLRGGLHFALFPWQYRIHKVPLVTVSEGRIGYVYAKDGTPLEATQTLGKTIECNHFQEANAFLKVAASAVGSAPFCVKVFTRLTPRSSSC